jgi:serine/threonine protein kinase
MGRLFLSLTSPRARTLYRVRHRLAIVFFIVALLNQQHLYLVSREALRAKYVPTNFNLHPQDLHTRFWGPDSRISQFKSELLANREHWKLLGRGWEGRVYVYQNSVIKTYDSARSPFRNCAPASYPTARWPTEIPASLHFGGTTSAAINRTDDAGKTQTEYDGFLPVKAHFVASNSPGSPEEWHLVTPLVDGGTLLTLAERLSRDPKTKSYRDVDALYRPAFNRFLKSLAAFHNAGYCHDDIKPSNIFVQDASHWLLGDLGNVREVHHPYHTSRIWRDSKQVTDCRSNDVVRTLQSYLKFIQVSLPVQDAFNTALFQGREPISKLFWWTLADAEGMSAQELLRRSLIEYPEAIPASDSGTQHHLHIPVRTSALLRYVSNPGVTKFAVDYTLWTTLTEARARIWGLVWLIDLPRMQSCDV